MASARIRKSSWTHDGAPANENLQGPTLRARLMVADQTAGVSRQLQRLNTDGEETAQKSGGKMTLVVECGGLSSRYDLLLYTS